MGLLDPNHVSVLDVVHAYIYKTGTPHSTTTVTVVLGKSWNIT